MFQNITPEFIRISTGVLGAIFLSATFFSLLRLINIREKEDIITFVFCLLGAIVCLTIAYQ